MYSIPTITNGITFVNSMMNSTDAAKASQKSTLRFGPRVASNKDANKEQTVQQKYKRQRRGGRRYQEGKRHKQELASAAAAASNAKPDEEHSNTWRDGNAKPNRGAANKQQHTNGAKPSAKRIRTAGETPPDDAQKPKRQAMHGKAPLLADHRWPKQ